MKVTIKPVSLRARLQRSCDHKDLPQASEGKVTFPACPWSPAKTLGMHREAIALRAVGQIAMERGGFRRPHILFLEEGKSLPQISRGRRWEWKESGPRHENPHALRSLDFFLNAWNPLEVFIRGVT